MPHILLRQGEGRRHWSRCSSREKVGDLAERLFYSIVFAGNAKVYSISIQLFEDAFSSTEVYRNPIEAIKRELEEREKIIIEKFINDPRVKQVAEGRKVTFIPQINLLCEMESDSCDKIVVELIHGDFDKIMNLLNNLSEELIEKGLAKRILGYKLGRSIDELKVEEVEVWKDEVTVWLV
ncbi:MAG: hypothetical protein ACP5PQ_02565 [Thermoproteota archaeon]